MRTQRIGKFSLGMALALMVMLVTIPGPATAAAPNASGFRALSGDTAANFVVPSDMRLVRSFYLATYGLTYERYQQYYGTAQVLGAQITLYRDEAGTITTVIGAHYPDIVPTNVIGLSEAAARARVERDIGAEGQRNVDLLINPTTGRYFYRLETRRFASRWFHWIDAGNGQVLNKYNGIAHADGIGVKGDTKDMSGLTTLHDTSGHGASGSHWDLFSTDNRQQTYDYGNKDPFIYYVTDEDNHWDLVTSDGQSPGHPALVDAQYYAKVTDDYLSLSHSFDWINSGCGYTAMQSIAHYNKNYNNAFWNGTYTVYGDGDGEIFRELSGGLDVVAHEHTHGVTECTSNLIYQDESGALNESFSDMLGTSAEFYAEENLLEPSAAADWFIGEDVYLPTDDEPGFRNMADPEEDGDPDHYTERQVGGDDNGGVHTNSGIPNHAYYLLVNGGRNASCASPGDHNSDHCTGSEAPVTGIGLVNAEHIFFLAFIGLSGNATMCDARAATEATAGSNLQSTTDAWVAVGLTDTVCGGSGANTAPSAAFTFTTSGLTADFTDQSTDSGGGSITSWSWDFGDDNSSTAQNPSHTYAAYGIYTVTLTVTDNDGATDAVSQGVTVADDAGGITLTVTGYKVKGLQKADLTWSDATSTNVDVYRDDALIATTANDGFYTDQIDQRGGGSYTYKLCEAGTSTCSNEATITF